MPGVAQTLLPWFETHRRVLPFRAGPHPETRGVSAKMRAPTPHDPPPPAYKRVSFMSAGSLSLGCRGLSGESDMKPHTCS